MKRYTVLDKHAIQKFISEYSHRREQYRKEGKSALVKKMSMAIERKRRSLRLIECKEKKVNSLARMVNEFTNFNVWQSTSDTREIAKLAKGIFCKYGIEHGIKGTTLSSYLGAKHTWRPSRIRKEFQQSFSSKPERREKWHEFMAWIKREEEDAIEDSQETPMQDT